MNGVSSLRICWASHVAERMRQNLKRFIALHSKASGSDRCFAYRPKCFGGGLTAQVRSEGKALHQPWQIAGEAGGLADEAAAQRRGGVDQPHADVAGGAEHRVVV